MTQPELRLGKVVNIRNLRPIERAAPAYFGINRTAPTSLYIVHCKGFTKIGIARDVRSRHSSLQVGCPYPLAIVFHHRLIRETALLAEHETMVELNAYHWRNEWFKCSKGTAIMAAMKVISKYSKT